MAPSGMTPNGTHTSSSSLGAQPPDDVWIVRLPAVSFAASGISRQPMIEEVRLQAQPVVEQGSAGFVDRGRLHSHPHVS